MPKYLLDTNICIYIMKRTPEQVALRVDRCLLGEVVMSSITYAELEYGVLCAEDPAEAKEQLDILVKAVPVVSFDAAAATAYGPIRLATKERKKDLMDKLIAAHAVALRVTVVTNNVDDFKVYPGVKIENWVEAN
ncbi:MAG: type II toxin-antitoxin system VapC family toxin [Glaciimonas sp.]|nr:type II toxin-antitoxin system VapC family toxin [Glaciimonas sp.]